MLLITLAAIIAALLFAGALLVVHVLHLNKALCKCKRHGALEARYRLALERELEILQEDANRLALELEELTSKADALDGRLAYALVEERKLKKMFHDAAARALRFEHQKDLLLRIGMFRRKDGRFGKAKGVLGDRIIFQKEDGAMMDWLLNR